ncbi:MAG: hypothetical protein IJY14_00625 [Acholeplasmatales bacterium]|nr:hypothetical protein [Acholeplasmatales bacterium]
MNLTYLISSNTIFYNIVSILIGLILIAHSISSLKKNKKLFGILTIIHSLLFIGFGIGGFFLPKGYEVITILAMLAFCITMVLSILLFNKKEKKIDTGANKSKK